MDQSSLIVDVMMNDGWWMMMMMMQIRKSSRYFLLPCRLVPTFFRNLELKYVCVLRPIFDTTFCHWTQETTPKTTFSSEKSICSVCTIILVRQSWKKSITRCSLVRTVFVGWMTDALEVIPRAWTIDWFFLLHWRGNVPGMYIFDWFRLIPSIFVRSFRAQ